MNAYGEPLAKQSQNCWRKTSYMQWEHLCAGLESGIEAAIHAVRKSFKEDNIECLLLMDADNAFNSTEKSV